MAEIKTKKSDASVGEFIATIKDAGKQEDARTLLHLMQRVTGEKPKMWGSSIIGFGDLHYRYASGREGDWFLLGFSPRAQNLTVYLMGGLPKIKPLLPKLGKHKISGSCLHLGGFSDIDLRVLESVLRQGAAEARALEHVPRSPAGPAAKKTKRATKRTTPVARKTKRSARKTKRAAK